MPCTLLLGAAGLLGGCAGSSVLVDGPEGTGVAVGQTVPGQVPVSHTLPTNSSLYLVYKVQLIRFKPDAADRLSRAFAQLDGTKTFQTVAIRESDRVYSLETRDDPGRIEERIYQVLAFEGIDLNHVRFEFSDTMILIENFGI